MLAEALKTLFAMFTEAQDPKLLMDAPTAKIYLINGEPYTFARHKPARNHSLDSLEDLAALANARHKPMDGTEATVVVWYGRYEIRVVLDNDGHRLDTATMKLLASEQFLTVKELGEAPTAQRNIIKALTSTLKGAIADYVLLDKIRIVQFENNQTTRAEKSQSRESISKSLIGELIKAEEIPNEVTLNIPVFSNPGMTSKYPIQCNFEIDPQNQLFLLRPQPEELPRIIELAMNDIRAVIEENFNEGIPIYQGREA